MTTFSQQHCITVEQGLQVLDKKAVEGYLSSLDAWHINAEGNTLLKEFHFSDFYRTMAFVNAVAWIANLENHHPDLEVGYNRCRINYTTHEVGGLSINDFICASRIDVLDS